MYVFEITGTVGTGSAAAIWTMTLSDPPKPKVPTDPVTMLIHWIMDNIFLALGTVILLYLVWNYFMRKPDPPKVKNNESNQVKDKYSVTLIIIE